MVVGLGNPGRRYDATPHNAGFRVCDLLVERHALGAPTRKFQGSLWRGRALGLDLGVLKPETYMNLSGEAVAEAVRYLPMETEDLVVVFDDMDLPLGRLRIRPRGGAGGHLGLSSVIECLGTNSLARVRIGVGRPPDGRNASGFLLGRVSAESSQRLEEAVDRASRAVETLLSHGIDEAMNRYNPAPLNGEEEEKG